MSGGTMQEISGKCGSLQGKAQTYLPESFIVSCKLACAPPGTFWGVSSPVRTGRGQHNDAHLMTRSSRERVSPTPPAVMETGRR